MLGSCHHHQLQSWPPHHQRCSPGYQEVSRTPVARSHDTVIFSSFYNINTSLIIQKIFFVKCSKISPFHKGRMLSGICFWAQGLSFHSATVLFYDAVMRFSTFDICTLGYMWLFENIHRKSQLSTGHLSIATIYLKV